MKNTPRRTLRLATESIRILTFEQLRAALGGGRPRPGDPTRSDDVNMCSGCETC